MKIFYWIGGVLTVIAIGYAGGWLTTFLWPKLQDSSTASAASAMGTLYGAAVGLLSAVASAVAAIAALMAARKSDETAQRAGEALGLAMEPALTAHIGSTQLHEGLKPPRRVVSLEVKNLSRWPAVDVKVYASDRRFRPIAEIEYLPPAEQPNYTIDPKPSVVSVEVTDMAVAKKAGFGKLLILDYSDERRILRWRQTLDWTNGLQSEVERVK